MNNPNANRNLKPKGYVLACHHKVWFKIPPLSNETIFCFKCQEYQLLLNSYSGRYYDPDGEYWMERQGKHHLGKCLYKGCEHSDEAWSAQALVNKLHRHYMAAHTRFGIVPLIVDVPLPPNSDPPF